MNWGRVLNIFISIFLVINVFLYFGYNYINKDRYTLTNERINQLTEILYENDILLYCELPDYRPRSNLMVEVNPKIDEGLLIKTIFGDNIYSVSPITNGRKYSNDENEISIFTKNGKNIIVFRSSSDKYRPKIFEEKQIRIVAEDIIRELTQIENTLTIRNSNFQEDIYNIEFNEMYKGEIVFSSVMYVEVRSNGIVEVKVIRYAPRKFIGEKQDIHPVDEVLYKFMYYIEDKDNKIFIKNIDIGYYIHDNEFADKNSVVLVPHYRITLVDGEYYINAITNTIRN